MSSLNIKQFASNEGFKLLSNVIGDEIKLLQETKKLLEKRTSLDEQYARNLQDLAATADRVGWPVNTHPISTACRDGFLQWSYLATTISSSAAEFRRNTVDSILKDLIKNKIDAKKFLDDEKAHYDSELRKARSELADAERRYFDEARSYAVKKADFDRLEQTKKTDDAKLKRLKESVDEKGVAVCRAHNTYILKLREYNFADEIYVLKIRNLLDYHEESQYMLNKIWQNILEDIVKYPNSNREEMLSTITSLKKTISLADPAHCYDEIYRMSISDTLIVVKPETFNDLTLCESGIPVLKANLFRCDDSTDDDFKQKIESLEANNDETSPEPQAQNSVQRRQMGYATRKSAFERVQQLEYLEKKKRFEEDLCEELQDARKNIGDSNLSDRLEDQYYFHGVLPREETVRQFTTKGDFLVRLNKDSDVVLSVRIVNPDELTANKDAHFIIKQNNQGYSVGTSTITRLSIPQLIMHYNRSQIEVKDGARLIRPIGRPDYMIKNEEVHELEAIGKGHFGRVSRAEYRGTYVAVKILHPTSTERNARDRQNFVNEALLLKQYSHKNIVKFIGIAAIRDPMMIVMELVERGSLSSYLRNNNVRVPKLIEMCYDIAKGMDYLEKNNVIHRDLAARNCLVDKRTRVKVADFGLSRCIQSDEEYFCQIQEVPVRWWAVEVFSNSPYTHKSDVWSYGVTAWEIFSKADPPYSDIQQNHLVIQAVKRGARLKQPEKCPAKVFTIMSSCWLLQPDDRPNFEKIVELLKKERSFFPK